MKALFFNSILPGLVVIIAFQFDFLNAQSQTWTCGDTIHDSRNGQIYNTVQIGNQCWMAENLNIGTRIDGINDQTDNATIEKYCYANQESNCDTYGGLYQWDEMMEYETIEGVQGICPAGWHLPTDAEWCTLENEVDAGTISCSSTDWRGIDAGGNLKETGTTHWASPNTGATNSSGFTGLPGGYRGTNGSFYGLTSYAHFYSSSENGSNAWMRNLYFSYAWVWRGSYGKAYGFSVRCIKDTITIVNQPPAIPSNPQPEDEGINIGIDTTLSWSCSDPENDPLTFDVYFGTSNPPGLVSTGQNENTFDPGTLSSGTIYYWKIVAHDNQGNTTEGQVWSFTTETLTNNLIVNTTVTISSDTTFDFVLVTSSGVLIADDTITVNGNMIIESGGIVRHSNRMVNGLQLIIVDTLEIQSGGAIDVNSRGLRGGGTNGSAFGYYGETFDENGNIVAGASGGNGSAAASHGGVGQVYGNSVTNDTYGLIEDPQFLGSGGGAWGQKGGNGGGRINITADHCINNGMISANSNWDAWDGSGGSGGSIWMDVNHLNGDGSIMATGGGDGLAAGGGGGRIAIFYNTINFSDANINAYGTYGGSSSLHGSSGTIYLKNKIESSGSLILDNADITTSLFTPLKTLLTTFEQITIRNRGTLEINVNCSIQEPLILTNNNSLKIGAGGTLSILNTTGYDIIVENGGSFALDSGSVLNANTMHVEGGVLNTNTVLNYPNGSDFLLSDNGTINILDNSIFEIGFFNPTNITSGTIYLSEYSRLDISDNMAIIGESGSSVTLIKDGAFGENDVINNLTVQSGGIITHSLRLMEGLQLNVSGTLEIQLGGMIDISGMGLLGGPGGSDRLGESYDPETGAIIKVTPEVSGGSYGGLGGGSYSPIFGNEMNPAQLGSGGGGGAWASGQPGGNGSGSVFFIANTLIVNGSILANGQSGLPAYPGSGGGGSGGTVNIDVGNWIGSGFITANGGNSGNGSGSGGGSGGRIAIKFNTLNYTGTIECKGGIPIGSGYAAGTAGTIYLKDNAQSFGDLVFDGDGITGYNNTNVTLLGSLGARTFKIVEVKNYGQLEITPEMSPFTIVDSLVISSSGRLRLKINSELSQTQIILNSGTIGADDTITLTGQTLKGIGTVDANLVNGGIISPGDPLGILTVTQSYTQLSSGILNIDLGGTTPETEFDVLNVNDSVLLDGILNVAIVDGFVPSIGNSFDIVTYNSGNGNFNTVNGWDINSIFYLPDRISLNYELTPLTGQASASPSEICQGDSTQLNATATGGYGNYSYSWTSDPPGFTSTSQNPVDTPFVNTTYYVMVSDNNDTIADSAYVLVYSSETPSPVENLFPPDSSFNIQLPIPFSWDSATNASSYDLYIWRSNEQKPTIPTVADLPENNYSYSEYLNINYLYNWQVHASNPCSEDQSKSAMQVFSFINFPDLLVDTITLPDTAMAGDDINITYKVSNNGLSATGWETWKDEVYLSLTPEFNDTTAIKVGSFQIADNLETGEYYNDSVSITLGNYLEGSYYVFVKADGLNEIQETHEDNNLLGSSGSIQINLPPYPDLFVRDVQAITGSMVPDSIFSLGWIVENIGDTVAIGGWSQKISILSGPDRYMLGFIHYGDSLSASGITSQSASFSVPKILGMDGNVYIEVELIPFSGLIEKPNGAGNNIAVSEDSVLLEKRLYITFPQAAIHETDTLPQQCQVKRSGSLNEQLDVGFAVSDTSRLSVSETIAISSGHSTGFFEISAINNQNLEGLAEVTVYASANDYPQQSKNISIVDDETASLQVYIDLNEADEGDTVSVTVIRDLVTDEALAISLNATGQSQLTLPSNVSIDPLEASVIFDIAVTDDAVPELTQDVLLSASAPAYISGSDTIMIFDDDLPVIELTLNPDTISEAGGPYASWGKVERLEPGSGNITIQLSADPSGVIYFPDQVTIPGNAMFQQFNVGVIDNGIIDGDREVQLTASVYISSCGCGAPPESGGTDSTKVWIIDNDGPSLAVSSEPFLVHENITNAGILNITRNTQGGEEIDITIQHNGLDEIIIPTTATIPANEDSVEVSFSTIDDGIEDGDQIVSINVSSPGYSSGNCWIMVSDRNLPDYVLTGMAISNNSILINDSIDVSLFIVNEGFAIATDGAEVNIYLSTNSTLDDNDQLLASQLTQEILIIGDSLEINANVKISHGIGEYYIIAVVNEDEALNELVGINNTSQAEPLLVEPDYYATANVEGDVFNGTTPITITGTTESVIKEPVSNKQVEVYIVVNGLRRVVYTTSNEQGNFSVDFNPVNGEAGYFYVGACYPGSGLNEVQDDFTILGAKPTASGFIIWELWENETKQLYLEIKNFSSIDLNNVNVEVLSTPPGCNISFTSVGNLPGNGYASISYSVEATAITQGNLYEEVQLKLTSGEGTEYYFSAWFYCFATTGNLILYPVSLNTTMIKNQVNYVEFEISNNGLDETGLINIYLPEVDWMALATPDTISSLQVGESAVVTLSLTPGEDLQLNNPISGQIGFTATNSSGTTLSFSLMPISIETGDLLVDVVDEYTYNTPSTLHVDSATVIISHPYTGQIIAQGITDQNGQFLAENINEGYYKILVQAEQHSGYQNFIYINEGVLNSEVIFIQFQAITYTWVVVPTQIEDEYVIELIVEFETNVPAPVVTIDTPDTMPQLDFGEYYPFLVTVTNQGLITAKDVELEFPDDPEYMFTSNIDPFDVLPQQSIQVPVVMERKPVTSREIDGNCANFTIATYKYECGPEDQLQFAVSKIIYEGRICVTNGIDIVQFLALFEGFPVEGPLGPGGPGAAGSGWTGGLTIPDPPEIEIGNIGCHPCIAEAINCVIGCLNPIPGPVQCAGSVLIWGLTPDVSLSCALAISGSVTGLPVGCVYCTLTTAWCFANSTKGLTPSGKSAKSQGMEQVYDDMEMLYNGFDAITKWGIENYGNPDLLEKVYFNMFNDSVAYFFDNQLPIDSVSESSLINSFINTDITQNEIIEFVSYWNTTLEARDLGIYSPTPEYPNIIDTLLLNEYKLQLDTAIQYTHNRDYPSLDSLYYSDIMIVASYVEQESSSVCATVSVQFSQTLTMTREAFEGTLTIFNGHEIDAMEDISLNLEVRDETGNIRNDLFQINTISLDQITGIDGSGILNALATGTAVVMFIPEIAAAPNVPEYYSFGGTFSYLDPFTDEVVTLTLFPVILQVNPSPNLSIDYFMQRNIFGDDALTVPIEASIPAELAVMIDNQGAGTAQNVKLESAQPQIIDNDKGLLIDFDIIGSNLSGEPVQLGLYNVNFGDIEAGGIAIGQWWFTSSLLGHFISYEASVNHLDSYGNQDLSLISDVDIHELIKSISVYGPLYDTINDFLVNDFLDTEDIPDAIYYSNGIVSTVVYTEDSQTDGPVTFTDTIVELTVTPYAVGWNYTRLDDPGDGLYQIVSITRDDTLDIPIDNVWLTYSTIPDGGEPIYENKLHLIDKFELPDSAVYTIVFEPIDQDVPAVIAINGVPEEVADQAVENVEVVFSEPIESTTFTYEDMILQYQGGGNVMDSLVIITQINDTVFNVDISSKTSESGYYVLTVQAAGVSDLVGNYGVEGYQVSWIQAIAVPAIDMFIGLPVGSGIPTDTVLVQFNMPIDSTTFTVDQLRLKLLEDDSLSVETLSITQVDSIGTLYKISSLMSLTTIDGTYELTVIVSEIVGKNGMVGLVDQFVQWNICQIPFPSAYAGENDTICEDQSYQLTGIVDNYSSFIWSTSGTGTFDNDQILLPVYYPGLEDIDNGFVEISLTAFPLNSCTDPDVSSMILSIQKFPVAIAGDDASICEDQTLQLSGIVENESSFEWITTGDGSFNDYQIINPIYDPGILDIETGSLELYLIAQPNSGCGIADSSKLTISIQRSPFAYAGNDTTICENQILLLSGEVGNESTFYWSTTGDGSFDFPQSLNPIYTPGAQDIINGSSELILFAQTIDPCEYAGASTLVLTIQPLPTVSAGNPGFICEGDTFMLSEAYAINYDSLEWVTNGTGYFDDPDTLNPTYYPGTNETGMIMFTIWAYGENSCDSAWSETTLEINPAPTAFAGSNASVVVGETYYLHDALATDYQMIEWSTDGSGYFDDPFIQNPTYHPGLGELGDVTLSIAVAGLMGCNSAFSSMTLDVVGIEIDLDVKVYLEGPFFNGQMTPFLNVFGYLPTFQPYNRPPWDYDGADSIDSFTSFNIIDWVFVEIVKFTEGLEHYVVGKKAGFVLFNGSVTDLDGNSYLNIKVSDTSDIHVCINHRNHLRIFSANPLQYDAGVYHYDFSTNPDQSLGGSYILKELAPGLWGMLSGNGNADDQINNVDKNEVWFIEKGNSGYFSGDYNMDSQVDTDDKVVKWRPNSGKGIQIPH